SATFNPGFAWNGRGYIVLDWVQTGSSYADAGVRLRYRNQDGGLTGSYKEIDECGSSCAWINLENGRTDNLYNWNGLYLNGNESWTTGCQNVCGYGTTTCREIHQYGDKWVYLNDWTCLGSYSSSSVSDTANRNFTFGEAGLYLYPAVDASHGGTIWKDLGYGVRNSALVPIGRVTVGDCGQVNSYRQLNWADAGNSGTSQNGNAYPYARWWTGSAWSFENCDAYAMCWVNTTSGAGPQVSVGSDDGYRIWINGSMVADWNGGRGHVLDQDNIGAKSLGAGWNRILFKVHNGCCGFGGTIGLHHGSDWNQMEPSVNFQAIPGYSADRYGGFGVGAEQDGWYPTISVSSFYGSSSPACGGSYYGNSTTVAASGTSAGQGPVPYWKTMQYMWGNGTTGGVTTNVVVINPYFITPILGSGGYQYGPSGSTGWSWNNAGIAANNSPWYTAAAPAPASQAAFIQATGAYISQDIYFHNAGNYKVSWQAIGRSGAGPKEIQLQIDGNAIKTFTPNNSSWTSYTSDSFSVGAGSHTLKFLATSTGGSGDLSSCVTAVAIAGTGTISETDYANVTGTPTSTSWSDSRSSVTGHQRFYYFAVSQSGRTSFQDSGSVGGRRWQDSGNYGRYYDVYVDNVAPLNPSFSSVTAASTTQINLGWSSIPLDQGVRIDNSATEATTGITPGGANGYVAGDVGVQVYRGGSGVSGWVTGTSYNSTGLSANTQYTYTIAARDNTDESRGAWHNATAAVGSTSKYTLIEVPATPTFGTIATDSIVLNTSGCSNPSSGSSGLYFDSTTTGGDAGINAWVQVLTDTATGLSPNTQYTFQAKARNGDSVETGYSGTASAWTLSVPPAAGTVTAPAVTYGDNVTWTAVNGFGAGKVQYYRYVFDRNATKTSWSDTETQWSSGTLPLTPTEAGTWYLHIKGYNGANVGNGYYDYAVTVNPKHITGTFTAGSKVYDALPDAAVLTRGVNGLVFSDAVTLDGGTANFADRHVGMGKTVSLTGASLGGAKAVNYVLDSVGTTTANITPKALTVTGLTASAKVYDATTVAPLGGTAALQTAEAPGGPTDDGKPYTGDDVAAAGTAAGAFADRHVGTAKAVTVTGNTLSGAQAGNY
ncbi:MAG TPA: YDG domain-containing protein, partial [Verrucomicrobiota bacterium]|nr:YDG domain-containing protein [Verrucomicrobiota bacterium]